MLDEAKKMRKAYGSPNTSSKSKKDYGGGRKWEDMHTLLEEFLEEKMPAKGNKNKKRTRSEPKSEESEASEDDADLEETCTFKMLNIKDSDTDSSSE